MKPVELRTARLVLDQPTMDDVDLVTGYCQDPLFEKYMVTPWPYQRSDAEQYLGTVIPIHWEDDSEYSWALRLEGELIGLIGFRTKVRDIGYWLGAPHRGRGYMPEAVSAVVDWVFARDSADILWECVPGNISSASVARKAGFTFHGLGPALYATRGGEETTAWRGSLATTDSREPKAGWPTE
ncbi:MAG TPA: GNAT family N-acetyltransferase [Galbitalea sp.]|jgi:RimJ/RimL family protein N-acetyltransferase